MSSAKAAKVVALTAKASEHSIATKVRSIVKWVKTGITVKVQITGKPDRFKAISAIYDEIEDNVKAGARIQCKVIKPEYIKFEIAPTDPEKLHVPEKSKELIEPQADKPDVELLSDEFEKDLIESIRREREDRRKSSKKPASET